MNVSRVILTSLAALALCIPAWADDRDERIDDLNDLSSRLNRHATSTPMTEEREFLHERVTELLVRARKSIDNEYVFGRLEAAIDDFLDASTQIEDALEDGPGRSDTRQRAARELEDTYFDLIQGKHFARQSGDPYANQYVRMGRRLYQLARASYEQEQYAQARDLAEAAREVVAGLEALAQAAVRVPTPPQL